MTMPNYKLRITNYECGVLQEGLSAFWGRAVSIAHIEREPLETSSHPVDRLYVTFHSGERLRVIFKRLHPGLKLYGNEREVLVYQKLLVGGRFGAPELYASLYDEEHGRYWLFLEDVGDWTLDDCDLPEWLAATHWLAEMHCTYQGREDDLCSLYCLEDHGQDYYCLIAETARHNLRLASNMSALARFDTLMRPFDAVIEYLTRQPRTLVHGDIFTKNLMVQKDARIRPIDWESAGIGVAAWDLARLMDGWGADKPQFIEAYLDAVSQRIAQPIDRPKFARTLAHCEIINTLWHLRWSVEECQHAPSVDGLLNAMQTYYGCLDDPERILTVLSSHTSQAKQ